MHTFLLALLASFASTVLGLLLFEWAGVRKRIDLFMIALGQAIAKLNAFGLSEEDRIGIGQSQSLLILKRLFLFFISLALVMSIAGIPIWLIDHKAMDRELFIAALGLGMVPGVLLYYKVMPKKTDAFAYPASKQLLYYLALGVPKTMFWWAGKKQHCATDFPFLTITGLARAGTTTLLHYLQEEPGFQSITYRCMPFLSAPGWWLKWNKGKSQKKERSHRDGIKIDLDSPEAFDEYFWRIVAKEKYYREAGIAEHELGKEEVQQFARLASPHIQQKGVYLSKNNNFILRLKTLIGQLSGLRIVWVFREPWEHAQSLRRQHGIQREAQSQEPFILDYMNWLGHHEFGLGRRDFLFDGQAPLHQDPAGMPYWLERWCLYYEHALALYASFSHEDKNKILWVDNQDIAKRPGLVLRLALAKFDLVPTTAPPQQEIASRKRSNESKMPALEVRAAKVYQQLLEHRDNSFRNPIV